MTEHIPVDLISTIAPLLVGILLAAIGGATAVSYVVFKRILLNTHNLVKLVKEAFDDDQLTPEETRGIIGAILKLIKNNPEAAAALLNSKK